MRTVLEQTIVRWLLVAVCAAAPSHALPCTHMRRDSDGAGMPAGLDPKPVTYRDDGTRPASFNGYLPD